MTAATPAGGSSWKSPLPPRRSALPGSYSRGAERTGRCDALRAIDPSGPAAISADLRPAPPAAAVSAGTFVAVPRRRRGRRIPAPRGVHRSDADHAVGVEDELAGGALVE